jgi:hypothetical protein
MPVIPATWKMVEVYGSWFEASPGKNGTPYLKNKLTPPKREVLGSVAQVVERLSSTHKSLSLKPQ